MSQIFDFSVFPVLTTDRLRLRQFTPADAPALMPIFGAPEMLRFLNQPPIDTAEKALGMLKWFEDVYTQQMGLQWAVTLHGQDAVIGTCGFYQWDRENRHVDIGYHIAHAWWGHGYATEAAHAMLHWCFEHLDVHRIQADCTDGHLASERVMLKCGFRFEGLWRESCWEHGRFVDIKQFGLLRREYQQVGTE